MKLAFVLLLLLVAVPVGAAGPTHLVVRVSGMDCAGCNGKLAAALDGLEFVEASTASFAAQGVCGTLTGPVDEEAVRTAVATTGYPVVSIEPVAGCPEGLRGALPEPWDGRSAGLDVTTISHGEPVDLDAHLSPGKATIFDFGASWCGPCHEVAEALAAWMSGADDVAVRAIELGGVDPSASYAQPVVAQHLASVSGIPWLIVKAPNGRVLVRTRTADKAIAAIEAWRTKGRK